MEALLYKPLKGKKVRCDLCHHRCVIDDGCRGKCSVRENQDGTLQTLVYERLIANHIDPIEKKPLFHFMPGSLSFSVATVGCNFKCSFCQNSDIAQMPADRDGQIRGDVVEPETIVHAAKKNGCASISYTYTEPTIYFEFAFKTAKIANQNGIKNVFVTNGYMTAEALQMIHPYLDAANVDLKAFSNDFYKDLCGAKLEPVKETLKLMKSLGIFIEITTLIIPGLNDDKEELENLALFIVKELGPETPWHISRFHPTYRLTNKPSTPIETLISAREIGINAGLKYVYTGNVPGENGENTFCWKCKELLIERLGFQIRKNLIKNSSCVHCGAIIDGIGM
ncbi:MAG: AmmeMemoRadiSam system radical SAM enzyme [Desulfobacterales bacterium]|nr:AmmeMemoRadiSam system radical SAM enzyme [Desulfobacterales bacterium]